MTDTPHDAESLIAWFTATEIVRHNGTREDRKPLMTIVQARLLAARIGQTSYYGPREMREANPWHAEELWNVALVQQLFMNDRFGWIDREGNFWGNGHAAHELMLHMLNINISDAEQGGWIRVSMSGVQSMFTPSEPQRLKMITMGYERQAANMMYEGVEPSRSHVKAARVSLDAVEPINDGTNAATTGDNFAGRGV